ncbi:MAG TPA: acetylglutamate kinase [Candidatus Binatia bacterium]|nr:acetylglutamate kinase [Candidatus Binatia bacterium]
MSHNYARVVVVKYGGGAMPAGQASKIDPILAEIVTLREAGSAIVLVHGGGPEIDAALARRGVESARIDGLRVTDAATLETTEAVLCATVNKRIVRAALALGIQAVGISGQDGDMLVADRAAGLRGHDLGYVGRIVATDVRLLRSLFDGGFVPVVAPLAVALDKAHAYNVNADHAAAAIAAALRADVFVAITNVPRVFRDANDPASGIDRLTADEALLFAGSAACRSSMKPKVESAARAVRGGASAAFICLAKPNAIAAAIGGDATIIC